MSGFSTRVKLLEKWAPSLLPQLKDLDDLADIILDVWNEAEANTEERIIKLIEGWAYPRYEGTPSSTPEEIELLTDLIYAIKKEQ